MNNRIIHQTCRRMIYLAVMLVTLLWLSAGSLYAAQITLDRTSVNLIVGQKTTIRQSSSGGGKITWKSSNRKIASVSKSGTVKGKKAGSCVIKATLKSGESCSVKVTVYSSRKRYAKKTNLILIGHRGDRSKYPENSLDGIRSTWKIGWAGAECDVYYTESGDFLIFHDANLKRVCGVDKSIFTVTEKNRFQYPLKKEKNGSSRFIPTLQEVFRAMKSGKGMLVLHLRSVKGDGISRLAAMIRMYDLSDRIIIYGVNINKLSTFEAMGMHTGYLSYHTSLEKQKEDIDACVKNGLEWYFPHVTRCISREMVEYAHSQGLSVGQVKVTTRRELTFLQDVGADMAMLNSRIAYRKSS